MSDQEKKWQRIYDLLNAETKPKFLCLSYIKQKKKFFLRKGGVEDWQKSFLTALATVIKKDLKTSTRKHTNEFESPWENCEDSN